MKIFSSLDNRCVDSLSLNFTEIAKLDEFVSVGKPLGKGTFG